MITIGSKSSVSYLSPIHKIDWISVLFNRRQSIDLERQYMEFNIRFFDITVRTDDEKHTVFCYSNIPHQTFSVYEILGFLNTHGGCMVRLTLDESSVNTNYEHRFYVYCANAEIMYPNISFCGGYSVNYPEHIIYHFNYEKNRQRPIKYISSLPEDSGKFKKLLYRICPRFYASIYNREMIERYSEENGVLLLDYIQYQ